MSNKYDDTLTELCASITSAGHKIERVIFGRDKNEIRVLYEDDGIYRVRALIEALESNREYYDALHFTSLLDLVIEMERDIAACYDDSDAS